MTNNSKRKYWLINILSVILVCPVVQVSSGAEVHLTAWIYNNTGWLNFHRQAFADYEALNPHIKIDMVPGTADTLVVALAGGVQVDFIYEASGRYTAPAAAGLYADLNHFIGKDETFNMSNYFTNAVEGYIRESALFGMPQTVSPAILFYNKNFTAQAGVVIPHNWTWDDLIAIAKKMTRQSAGSNTEQYGYAYENWTHYNRWPIYVWLNGGDVFSADLRQVIVEQPAAVEGLQFMKDLASVHGIAVLPGHPSLPDNNYTKQFEVGRAAMLPSTRFYNPPANMEYALAHMPKLTQQATSLISNYYSIIATSKHADESWKLIRYLLEISTKPGTIDRFTQALPSYIPNARELIINHPRAANELLWVEAMDYARMPYSPPISSWQDINNKYLTPFGRGDISARAAAEGIAREANALLNEYYAAKGK
ncbi:MAG TPA: extracellular solute-binding protein [Firmicutes bacterium]|nr:extracellular solute-binding protein [Bacillota bacterium]